MVADAQVSPSRPVIRSQAAKAAAREPRENSELAARRYAEQMELFDLMRQVVSFGARHITLLKLVRRPDFYVRPIMGPDYVAVAGRPPTYSDIGCLSRTEQISLACVMKYYYRLRKQGFTPERSLVSAYGACREIHDETASFDLAFHTVCKTEGGWGHTGGMIVLRPCKHCHSQFLDMRDLALTVRCPVCQTRARHDDLTVVPRRNAKFKENPSSDSAMKALEYAVERFQYIERAKAIGAKEQQAHTLWYRSQRLDCPTRYRSSAITPKRASIFSEWFASGSSRQQRRPLIGFLVRYEQLLEAGQSEHEALLTAVESLCEQGVLERSPMTVTRVMSMVAATRAHGSDSSALLLRASCMACRSTTYVPDKGCAPQCSMCPGLSAWRAVPKDPNSAAGFSRAAKIIQKISADALRARRAAAVQADSAMLTHATALAKAEQAQKEQRQKARSQARAKAKATSLAHAGSVATAKAGAKSRATAKANAKTPAIKRSRDRTCDLPPDALMFDARSSTHANAAIEDLARVLMRTQAVVAPRRRSLRSRPRSPPPCAGRTLSSRASWQMQPVQLVLALDSHDPVPGWNSGANPLSSCGARYGPS